MDDLQGSGRVILIFLTLLVRIDHRTDVWWNPQSAIQFQVIMTCNTITDQTLIQNNRALVNRETPILHGDKVAFNKKTF